MSGPASDRGGREVALSQHVRELIAGRALGDLSYEEMDSLGAGPARKMEHGTVSTIDMESVALEGTAGLVYLALASGATRAEARDWKLRQPEETGLPETMPPDMLGRLRRLAETYIVARGLREPGRAGAEEAEMPRVDIGGSRDVPAHAGGVVTNQASKAAASSKATPDRAPIVVSIARRVDTGRSPAGGWVALAAGLAIVAGVGITAWRGTGAEGRGEATPGKLLSDVRARPDAVSIPWGEWTDDAVKAEVRGVTGEVVWSDQAQAGVLRFEDLPFVEGTSYQLWIIDAERGMEQRVSGAVFQGGRDLTVVEIEPGLRIGRAAAFAVTIEQPGGTWVSDMTRRVVIAAR